MPIFEYDYKLFEESNYDKEKLCVIDKTLRQRKLDSSGNFSFTGTYAEYDDIELPAIKLYDLCDLFGFRVDFYVSSIAYDNEDYGDVKLQISFDGGVTYYYWNIVTWSLAGINDFSTRSDIETNISTFPWALNPTLRIKARIYSSDDRLYTPIIRSFQLFYEVDNNFEEDLLRTFKSFIQDNIIFSKRSRVGVFPFKDLNGNNLPLNKILISSSFDINDIDVYNITTDPRKQTNLIGSFEKIAGSITSDGIYILTLTGFQANGNIIEVVMRAKIDIYLGSDPAFYDSIVPAVAIMISDNIYSKNTFVNGKEVIINYSTKKARIRDEDSWKLVNVLFICSARGELNSLIARHGYEKALGSFGSINLRSNGNGQSYLTLDMEPYTDRDSESDGVFRKSINIILLGRQFISNYEEVSLAEEIEFGIELMEPPEFIELPDIPPIMDIAFE